MTLDLKTLTPTDNATTVAPAANLVIEFDEVVQKGTGDIVIKKADGSEDTTIAVTSAEVTINGNRVTINPTADLAESTEYYVEIDSGAIEDTAGNDYGGISDSSTWSFTTSKPITYDPVENSTISLQGVYYSAVATADFDNDGDTDILITGEDSSCLLYTSPSPRDA